MKKTEYEKWIRLTKDKNQYKSNIKVNWDSFEDSDEENTSEQTQYPNQQLDFSSMMNMGGGNNGFNMEEMMKNMNPSEMEQLMKSMNMGGDDDDDNDKDEDDDEDDDNDAYDNDAHENDENNQYEDKDLESELDNIINDDESIDSDDLCQECVIP